MKNIGKIILAVFSMLLLNNIALATENNIPKEILTPNEVKTSIGELKFFDGVPEADTVKKVYRYLDTMRGVQVFLRFIPLASLHMLCEGPKSIGAEQANQVLIFENLMDSTALYLTGNTSTVYVMTCLDLKKDGATVVELPENLLGAFNDAGFLYMEDVGKAGPDEGKGGKYVVLPPKYEGKIPDGYFPVRSNTYTVWLFIRGYLENGSPKKFVKSAKQSLKIYPLSEKNNPPKTEFIDGSGKFHNTVHANNFQFFTELNQVIQKEPADFLNPEDRGLLASIGIVKGQPFNPTDKMKKILTDSIAIGNAAARSLVYYPRDPNARIYPGKDSNWMMGYVGYNVYFLNKDGSRNLDARVMFHYPYTGISPAMATKKVGKGSDYAMAYLDAQSKLLNGSKRYKLHLPKNIPAKDFWAVSLYDTQTRSQLQTSQKFPSLSSQSKNIKANPDGSYDIYFSPTAPKGKEGNWLETVPGKSWFVILRIYGPLEAWINKTWRPGNIELMKQK